MSTHNDDFSEFSSDPYDMFSEEDFHELSQQGDEHVYRDDAEERLLGKKHIHQDDDVHHHDNHHDSSPREESYTGDGNILHAIAHGNLHHDDSDDMDAFERQRIINRQNDVAMHAPDDVFLIDDPSESTDKKLPKGSSGDEKTLTNMKNLTACMGTALVIVLGIAAFMFFKPEPPQPQAQPEAMQPSGDVIQQALGESSSSPSSSDSHSGNSSSSDDSTVTTTKTSSRGHGNSSSNNTIRYELISEAGIKTASVSFINGVGSQQSETGVSLPWSKTIKANSSITPHFAANPGERGTLTCKIYKGDKKIAEDTASGEKASVECKGK